MEQENIKQNGKVERTVVKQCEIKPEELRTAEYANADCTEPTQAYLEGIRNHKL